MSALQLMQKCRLTAGGNLVAPSLQRLRGVLVSPAQCKQAQRLQARSAARLVVAAAEAEATAGEQRDRHAGI